MRRRYQKKDNTGLIVGLSVGGAMLLALAVGATVVMKKNRADRLGDEYGQADDEEDDEDRPFGLRHERPGPDIAMRPDFGPVPAFPKVDFGRPDFGGPVPVPPGVGVVPGIPPKPGTPAGTNVDLTLENARLALLRGRPAEALLLLKTIPVNRRKGSWYAYYDEAKAKTK